jgi:hypothetical protein
MNAERYVALVGELCGVLGLPDPNAVLDRGCLEVDGMEVLVANFSNDPAAMYMSFHFGLVPAGRSLRVFRMMLEANMTIYAQDQAQMGMNPDTTGVILLVRVPMSEDIDGAWVAETITHYNDHARYWRNNILQADDDMYQGIVSGQYMWMKV